MLETISVFDNLAQDDTNKRVASRRALALADNTVGRYLGAYLAGARSVEEFDQRFALYQDDFLHYVQSAADEVGFEHPEYIAATLKDHYRLAVKFEETPAQEDEEDEEQKQAKTALMMPGAGGAPVDPTQHLEGLPNPLQAPNPQS